MGISKPKTAEDLLAEFPPPIAALTEELRRCLHEAAPTLVERVLPGWRAIGYRETSAGHICALFPLPAGVKLYFEHGASLEDPDGLLAGDMKQARYIEFRTRKDILRRSLTRLVRVAVTSRL